MVPRDTIEAFRGGEKAAFEAVVRAYGPVVRGVARRFFASIFDQEEAMQDVWLHLWKNRTAIDADRDVSELAGYIAVTARHRCIDILRRRKPSIEIHDDDVASPEPSARALAERAELHAAAAAFASGLKPQWRRFFDLHFVEGLPYEDVGAQLGIGKLRCKYMKKVIAGRARKDPVLLAALARAQGGERASP